MGFRKWYGYSAPPRDVGRLGLREDERIKSGDGADAQILLSR